MNDGAVVFGSIAMGMAGGIFGSLVVTTYFRWVDNTPPHPKSIFVFSAVIMLVLLAFVVYAFFKLKALGP